VPAYGNENFEVYLALIKDAYVCLHGTWIQQLAALNCFF